VGFRALIGSVRCALLGILFAACGNNVAKLVSPLQTSGSITIEIYRSTTPVFSWNATTAIEAISVANFRVDGRVDRILWGYRGIAATPPITYGSVIPGGISLSVGTPPALQSGNRYRVEVVSGGKASTADWIVP